jgi:hypothetical protein
MVSALAFASACNTKDNTANNPLGTTVSKEITPSQKLTQAMDMQLELLPGMTHKDVNDLMKAEENNSLLKKYMILNKEITEATSWQTVDPKVREFLSANQNHILSFMFSQQLSHFMLSQFLLKQSEHTSEQIDAIDYYISNLVKFKSFGNKILFSQALPRLQKKWQQEKIVEIAEKSFKYGAREMPKEKDLFGSVKVQKMTSSERQQYFMEELVTKRKMPQAEAVRQAAIMETVLQKRMSTPQEIPAHLPPEIQKQEDAAKILAALAGMKFISYEDRIKQEKQNR